MAKLIPRMIARDERLKNLTIPARGAPLTPAAAQNLAADAALRGVGRVAPNPLVGSVVVDREHRFLGLGGHEAVGGHHGEIQAVIAAAGDDDWRGKLDGATVYVTLEPCAHVGRTPACAPRLVEAGVRRVVFAVLDPNPKVSGRGAEILRAAGVEAMHDAAWADEGEIVAEVYLGNARRARPVVGLKAATSLDGVLARRGDRRRWITGPRARQYGHFLRLWYDAILVGRGTVEQDDPTLDARDAMTPGRVPWRVVVDPRLAAFAPQRKLLGTAPEKVLWCAEERAWDAAAGKEARRILASLGAQAVSLTGTPEKGFAPATLLAECARHGITSVLLEGGAATYAPFLAAGAVDKLHLMQAPVLFGDGAAIRLGDGAGPLGERRARLLEWTPLGEDLLVEASFGDIEEGR